MAPNKRERLRYRYGICLNDGCPKCKSKEVQRIPARKDLVCEECGKKLRECPPPKSLWSKYGKLITIAAVLVVIGVGILIYCLCLPHPPATKTGEDPLPVDTVTPAPVDTVTPAPVDTVTSTPIDTVKEEVPQESVKDEPKDKKKDNTPKPVKEPKTTASAIRVPFGNYSGPADGLGGEIRVTRHYSLDLRNAAHETIELQPGDVITRTKFKNGELVGGYWHRGSKGRTFHR